MPSPPPPQTHTQREPRSCYINQREELYQTFRKSYTHAYTHAHTRMLRVCLNKFLKEEFFKTHRVCLDKLLREEFFLIELYFLKKVMYIHAHVHTHTRAQACKHACAHPHAHTCTHTNLKRLKPTFAKREPKFWYINQREKLDQI